jgi:hypothetical protein
VNPFDKFKKDNPGMLSMEGLREEFLHDRLQFAFAQGQKSMMTVMRSKPAGLKVGTKWTKKIEKSSEAAFALGNAVGLGAKSTSLDQAGAIIDDLLNIAREQDEEMLQLAELVGEEATEEAINHHLDIYGNAFIFEGRLLDPAKLAIKIVKGKMAMKAPANFEVIRRVGVGDDWPDKTAHEEALSIVKKLHELYFKDGRAMAPPETPEGIVKDGLAMVSILQRVGKLFGDESVAPQTKEDMLIHRLLTEIGADRIEFLERGHLFKIRAWWDDECLRIIECFTRAEIVECEDVYEYVLEKLKKNIADKREQAPKGWPQAGGTDEPSTG